MLPHWLLFKIYLFDMQRELRISFVYKIILTEKDNETNYLCVLKYSISIMKKRFHRKELPQKILSHSLQFSLK